MEGSCLEQKEGSCLEQIRHGGQYSLTMLRIKSNARLEDPDIHTQVEYDWDAGRCSHLGFLVLEERPADALLHCPFVNVDVWTILLSTL